MYKKLNKDVFLYLLVLVMLLTSRILLLTNYNFEYVGSDDLIFWQAANDYSKGVFYEPYFYGQNYNFMLEAIFAVPLLWLGIPVYIALPVVTSIMFLFPFVLFSFIMLRKKQLLSAMIFLIIPLSMPVEYDLMTSLTRGFVSGFFPLSFLIFPLLKPQKKSSYLIFGICASFAFIINPSTIIFSFLVGCFLLFKNYKNSWFYVLMVLVTIPILFIEFKAKSFYVTNPDYLIHNAWDLNFSFEVFVNSISNLDKYFKYLTPIFWAGNWIIIILIFITGVFIFVKSKAKSVSIFLTTLLILITLGINKVNDGIDSVFLSSARMFLVLPLIFSLAIYWLVLERKINKKYKVHLISIGVVIFLIKVSVLPSLIKKETNKLNIGPIANGKIEELKITTSRISNLAKKKDVELIVFVPGRYYNVPAIELYNYSYNLFNDNTIKSVMVYDRRTWVFNEAKEGIKEKIMIFGDYSFINSNPKDNTSMIIECDEHNNDILIVSNNDKTLEELADYLGFNFKRKIYD